MSKPHERVRRHLSRLRYVTAAGVASAAVLPGYACADPAPPPPPCSELVTPAYGGTRTMNVSSTPTWGGGRVRGAVDVGGYGLYPNTLSLEKASVDAGSVEAHVVADTFLIIAVVLTPAAGATSAAVELDVLCTPERGGDTATARWRLDFDLSNPVDGSPVGLTTRMLK